MISMIKKYCKWLKEYWQKFFTPQGIAIYVTTVVVSSIVGKALSSFFSKKADEQIKRLEQENGKRDYIREAKIESDYYEAQMVTGAVAGTLISVIAMLLTARIQLKKGDN